MSSRDIYMCVCVCVDICNFFPQPAAIASHLKKQIAEVLEQKKRIQ